MPSISADVQLMNVPAVTAALPLTIILSDDTSLLGFTSRRVAETHCLPRPILHHDHLHRRTPQLLQLPSNEPVLRGPVHAHVAMVTPAPEAVTAAGATESDCLDTAHDGQPGGEPGRVSGASGFEPAI